MTTREPVMIVHGGAGYWPSSLHKSALAGVVKAADLGFDGLQKGGFALDAVEAAVVSMENNRIFNAGRGAALNLLGHVETDAAIMDGSNLRGGGVALLRDIRNPIRVARIVMDRTDHVLMAGTMAEKLAVSYGLDRANLKTENRIQAWKAALKQLRSVSGKKSSRKAWEVFDTKRADTVGALAMDSRGNLAAGDSTGGVLLKLPGRIGDSPILGAGLYADNKTGAATATGMGEQAMRIVISKMACDLMKRESAARAAARSVNYSTRKIGVGTGVITLDHKGRYGVAHNTRHLCWAARTNERREQRMWGARVRPKPSIGKPFKSP